jgi:hypothetical protein
MASGGMICTLIFMKNGLVIQIKLRLLPQQFEVLQCWYYRWNGFMKCVTEIGSDGMIYVPSFMKIGAGIQPILRFCLSNLRSCNVGMTEVRDL